MGLSFGFGSSSDVKSSGISSSSEGIGSSISFGKGQTDLESSSSSRATESGSGSDEIGRFAAWSLENTDFRLELCFSSPLDSARKLSLVDGGGGGKEGGNEESKGTWTTDRREGGREGGREGQEWGAPVKLCYLPNWWFSLALSSFIHEKANASPEGSGRGAGDGAGVTSEQVKRLHCHHLYMFSVSSVFSLCPLCIPLYLF